MVMRYALHDAASSAAQSDIGQCLNRLPETQSRAVAEVLGSGGGPTLGQPANCMHMHARQKHTVGGETRKARRRMKEWEGGVSTVVVTGAPPTGGAPKPAILGEGT